MSSQLHKEERESVGNAFLRCGESRGSLLSLFRRVLDGFIVFPTLVL